jgi:hypothetical protein
MGERQATRREVAKVIWLALALVGAVLALVAIGLGVWKIVELVHELTSPPPVMTKATVLQAVEQVNKQIFVQHDIVVDVTYREAPRGWLSWLADLGVRQEFIVLIWGRVPAGFDLRGMEEGDVWISADGTEVQLTLPAPTIFRDNVSIDFDKSRVLSTSDTCPGFLCEDTLTAYQQQALPEAQERLIEAAYQYGILEQAARDGKAFYEGFLKTLGFDQVQVIVTGFDF